MERRPFPIFLSTFLSKHANRWQSRWPSQKYENMAAEEKQRYARKYKSVYGVEPGFQKKAAATA